MIREGASIPIVNVFTRALGAPCVLLGLGLPDDNLHSPNEKFNLDCFHRGMKTSAWFLETMGGKV
jgi:acetylornithine deacetylase/succinyl-diaminopimelate desuccinylase-like protein